jgi:hypothetical protein
VYCSGVRRTPWFRAFVAIWCLWFTAAFTDAAGMHTCAMHGIGAVASASDAHAGHDMGGMATPAEQGASEQANSKAPSHGHTTCTCLGTGCCTGAVATPARATRALAITSVRIVVAEFRDVVAPDFSRPYELPFANGPPARA